MARSRFMDALVPEALHHAPCSEIVRPVLVMGTPMVNVILLAASPHGCPA
jgi:hypothetical protein